MLQVIKAEDVRDGEPRWWCPDDVYAARTLEWIVTSNLHTEWRGAADAFTLAIVDRPAPTPTPTPGLDIDAVADTMRGLDNIFAQAMSSRDAEIARLTAELAAARAEVDCGQDGPCAKAPGCARHWQERNRELVAELAAARAVPAEVEVAIGLVDAIVEHARTLDSYDWQGRLDDSRTSDDAKDDARELSHALRDYDRSNGSTFLRTAIARAISDATAAHGTVGGLLATAPVGAIVEAKNAIQWVQFRIAGGTEESAWRGWWWANGGEWLEWQPVDNDLDVEGIRQPARLVDAATCDASPESRGPLPKGG